MINDFPTNLCSFKSSRLHCRATTALGRWTTSVFKQSFPKNIMIIARFF